MLRKISLRRSIRQVMPKWLKQPKLVTVISLRRHGNVFFDLKVPPSYQCGHGEVT
jgi:hypothetical protein